MFELDSLNVTYNMNVESAYIITIRNNEISEGMAARCASSCESVGQPYKIFQAVDGTDENHLFIPEEYRGQMFLKWLKKVNTTLTNGEVACFMSHFLLWCKCVELNQPIVILEHDAIMVRPYLVHPFCNIISYLGCREQAVAGWQTYFPMPPHGQLNENYRFILRGHAYAIDPMLAKNMVAQAIKYGIYTSADVFMRIDQYGIIQQGLYAYDEPGETTIPGRPEKNEIERLMDINDKVTI